MNRENMRHDYGPGFQFSGDEARQAYIDEFEEFRRRAQESGFRYSVPPRLPFSTHDGRRLQPGEQLIPERDLVHAHGTVSLWGMERIFAKNVWEQLSDLVYQGRIIEADLPEPPAAA